MPLIILISEPNRFASSSNNYSPEKIYSTHETTTNGYVITTERFANNNLHNSGTSLSHGFQTETAANQGFLIYG